jgi:Asp-tRNA(Asn)/Glu-tRNA(Gln) amidotransferase A subunit family amidase
LFTQEPEPAQPVLDGRAAAELIGLEFTAEELALMADELAGQLASYTELRAEHLDNSVPPTGAFTPLIPGVRPNGHVGRRVPRMIAVEPPADWSEHLFELSIPELGSLLRRGDVTSVELTTRYLEHLAEVDKSLHCVVTLLPERALEQARTLDGELALGRDRGPLHGIPWGAKDLISVAGAPTTWGAAPFEDQVIEHDAAVVRRLDAAGAVLIAKLSLGALAWGDVWFGGTTRNPWNPEEGSSGSSAGPAAAVASGGVVFAIGSETLGSIVSPSARCGVSAIRPTFGRVSRDGAMALSWSMDKLGPMARSIDDAWLVLDAIAGPTLAANGWLDDADPGVSDVPIGFADGYDLHGKELRVGVPAGAFEGRGAALAFVEDELRAALEAEGASLEFVEVELPDYPVGAMMITLSAEAAAAFDELTRSGQDDELVRQSANAWPNVFRAARLIPAVEYIHAQRLRSGLIRDFAALMGEVDFLIHPPFASGVLSMTNLTGHPSLVAPVFVEGREAPVAISFTGRLFDEPYLAHIVRTWQASRDYHLRHPGLASPPAPEASDPAGSR